MLRLLLLRRFGSVPESMRARIDAASAVELEALFERALDAASLDELLDA